MKKFSRSGLCLLLLLILTISLAGCGETSAQEEWTTVIEFEGTFTGTEKEALSDVFEVTGGELRITYDLVTTSVGGNAMIYILPEGWTKTKDGDGNLKISVQEVSAVGDKTGEQKTFTKDAGKYFIDINTSSVESYKIVIEEKR